MRSIKKFIVILAVILTLISYAIVFVNGRETSLDIYYDGTHGTQFNYDTNIIECTQRMDGDYLHIDIKAVNPGKTNLLFYEYDEDSESGIPVYVHRTGIITVYSFLGRCNGDISFIITFYIIAFLTLFYAIVKYRKNVKKNLYMYANAKNLGLIYFFGSQVLFSFFYFVYDYSFGFSNSVSSLISSIQENIFIMVFLSFPLAVLATFLVTISNVHLLIKEGKSWKNMLGIILGGLICFSTVILVFARTVFSWSLGMGGDYIYYVLAMFIAYLQCVLIGTCVLGLKAARRVPKFDKDYIIILGCKMRDDGTLTNLLKSRVDRAIWFAAMQKKATGKDIIFVPSGGQGSDEVVSEALAMKNYLVSQGIDEDKIIMEDRSTSTYENIKFSNEIISKEMEDAKICFSTTNYHVLRAGIIASNQNIKVEGIGAKTKAYFWINAFIREFIATLVSERKSHIKTFVALMLVMLMFSVVLYLSNL